MATRHAMSLTVHGNGTATVRTTAGASLPEYIEIDQGADVRTPYTRDVRPGDVGCLVARWTAMCGSPRVTAWLQTAPAAGNCKHTVRRLHGWRGTTDGQSVTAYGWRRVMSVRVYGNGAAVVRLSADMRPNED